MASSTSKLPAAPDVEMEVRKSIRADSTAAREKAERDVTLDISADANVVRALVRYGDSVPCGEESNRPRQERHWGWNGDWDEYEVRYDFDVRVPRNTNLVICTVNGPEVVVRRVHGELAIHDVNGDIRIADARGSADVRTVNGTIFASFAAAPRADSQFRSVNGDLELAGTRRYRDWISR